MPSLISTGGHLLEFRKFPSRFGTCAENEIVVQDGLGVRDHHFTLVREGITVMLEAATEGTTSVNGEAVTRVRVRDGDRILAGELELIYSYPEGEPEEPGDDPSIITPVEDVGIGSRELETCGEKGGALAANAGLLVARSGGGNVSGEDEAAFYAGATTAGDAILSSPSEGAGANGKELDCKRDDPSAVSALESVKGAPETGEPASSEEDGGAASPETGSPSSALVTAALAGAVRGEAPRGPEGDRGGTGPVRPAGPPRRSAETGSERERPGSGDDQDGGAEGEPRLTGLRARLERRRLAEEEAGTLTVPEGAAERAQEVAGRLTERVPKPTYGLLIAWHKVGLFLCLLFAAAGVYMARSGPQEVERVVGFLVPEKKDLQGGYLRRLEAVRPVLMATADADRLVGFYRQWSRGEDWPRVEELDDWIQEYASQLRLADLKKVSVAMNEEGNILLLVTTKKPLPRRRLVRDLGRGLVTAERVGEVSVYEGFVGHRRPVTFALPDDRTLVIGDGKMLAAFVEGAETVPAVEDLVGHPGDALARAGSDWVGLFQRPGAWQRLRELLPETTAPWADVVDSLVGVQPGWKGWLMIRVGIDLRVDGALFASGAEAGEARRFIENWEETAGEGMARLQQRLGASEFVRGMRGDLGRVQWKEGEAGEAILSLQVPNRWAARNGLALKEALVEVMDGVRKPELPQPRLMTAEELQIREAARQVVLKYEQALDAGAKEVAGIGDVKTVVEALCRGVRGRGPYRQVTYRAGKASAFPERVMEVLEWEGERLRILPWHRAEARRDAEFLAREGGEEEP